MTLIFAAQRFQQSTGGWCIGRFTTRFLLDVTWIFLSDSEGTSDVTNKMTTKKWMHVFLDGFSHLRFCFLAFFFNAKWEWAGLLSPSNAKTNGRNADQTGCADEVGAAAIA